MLSRVEDARVFESSDDVILAALGRQRTQQKLQRASSLRSRASETLYESPEAAEDEQLHPQHPYRMRKRVLHRESGDFHQLVENETQNKGQRLVQVNRQEKRPMEFVFLSSGEIRAREDCPPEMGLPKLQQGQVNGEVQVKPRLAYQGPQYSSEEEADTDSDDEDNQGGGYEKQVVRRRIDTSRRQVRRQSSAQQHYVRPAASPSSSGRSSLSVSDEADMSSGDESEAVAGASSVVSEESRQEKRERAALGRHNRQVTRNAEIQVESRKSSIASAARNGVKSTPTRSLKLDHFRIEEDEVSEHFTGYAHRSKAARHGKAPTSEAPSRQRPAPLEQVSEWEDTVHVPTRRTKRSPKMEVGHLASVEPTPEAKDKSTFISQKEAKMIDRLESELQKEKKRVLEKMTQLLDEQGKSQALRDQVEALEAQLASKSKDTSSKDREAARQQEEQNRALEKEQADRIKSLEEQVHIQETKIARLKHDKDQLKNALKQFKKTENGMSTDRHSDGEELAALKAQLDDMTKRLQEFLAKVERWKSKSMDAMQNCDDKTGMPALLDHVWMDFPQFAGVTAKQHKEDPNPAPNQQRQSTETDEQADPVAFLKKRLRQREDELRQTHVKYVELKELCARQCVREADLQNFINEHRLRGNLIICKNSTTKPSATADNQAQTQAEPHEEHRQSAKLKMISSRGTNTPALYNDREGDEEQFVNEEYSDNQEEDDDYDEGDEEEFEYPVRTPKVFVQVGRDGVYERASPSNSAVAQKLASDRTRVNRKPQSKQQQRVERIRLVPSPSLAQRYERVATPTSSSTTTRRKKSVQHVQSQPQYAPQSSRSQELLGECPPGCGSRLPFTRKKNGSAAAVRKPTKRPVSTTASKGAIGVIRPWM